MKVFYNKRDNERFTCISDIYFLKYITTNNLNICEVEFLFDDQYNEQNINN